MMNDDHRLNLFNEWAKHYVASLLTAQKFPFDEYDLLLDKAREKILKEHFGQASLFGGW